MMHPSDVVAPTKQPMSDTVINDPHRRMVTHHSTELNSPAPPLTSYGHSGRTTAPEADDHIQEVIRMHAQEEEEAERRRREAAERDQEQEEHERERERRRRYREEQEEEEGYAQSPQVVYVGATLTEDVRLALACVVIFALVAYAPVDVLLERAAPRVIANLSYGALLARALLAGLLVLLVKHYLLNSLSLG